MQLGERFNLSNCNKKLDTIEFIKNTERNIEREDEELRNVVRNETIKTVNNMLNNNTKTNHNDNY